VDFYTNVIGLKFAHAISQDRVPSTQRDPSNPNWVQLLALEVADETAWHDGKRRLTERGIEVVGPTDHGFCRSIYFFDPSGHRMEMTARTEREGDRDRFAQSAPAILADWEARRRTGALNDLSVTA
jgi:glyoxylase I family protein